MPGKLMIVQPAHWIEPDGSFPDVPQVRRRAIRMAQCIEYAADLEAGEARPTLIPCRYRPNRQECRGFLWVLMQEDEAIHAFCPACKGDEFLIYEWQDTPWAAGLPEPIDIAESMDQFMSDGLRLVEDTDLFDDRLELEALRALKILGSTMTAGELLTLISRAADPGVVIRAVIAGLPQPPRTAPVEQFVGALMLLWNKTPRPELEGRTPTEVYEASPRRLRPLESQGEMPAPIPKVGRNDPCPCGSGKKYKRCCLARLQ